MTQSTAARTSTRTPLLALGALVLVALGLRGPVSSVEPVLAEVRDARGLGTVAVAVLPLVSGLAGTQASGEELVPALHRAVVVAGGLCLVAAATAWSGLPASGTGGEVAGKRQRLRR